VKSDTPIYVLKRNAKRLSRENGIPRHEALRRVAASQGFQSWSLLAARRPAAETTGLLPLLAPGDLVLVGARPGQGKTLLCLRLAAEAVAAGRAAAFFTLEYTERDVVERFGAIGVDPSRLDGGFRFDSSDAISAGYIAAALATAGPGTVAIVDYLQLLDQKRNKPDLAAQVEALKAFAREKGIVLVCIAQIDRAYDPSAKPFPDLADVRLPNPLDLGLFDKAIFLNGGEARFHAAR
jgi:replicative DNA helicase